MKKQQRSSNFTPVRICQCCHSFLVFPLQWVPTTYRDGSYDQNLRSSPPGSQVVGRLLPFASTNEELGPFCLDHKFFMAHSSFWCFLQFISESKNTNCFQHQSIHFSNWIYSAWRSGGGEYSISVTNGHLQYHFEGIDTHSIRFAA